MRTKLAVAFGIIGLASIGGVVPLLAHHSFSAEFDAKRPVNFRGTVTRVEWTNPHTWFHVAVKKPDGTVENWAIEAGSPSVLFRRGFTRAALPVGTEIVVDGYQSRDGSRRANGRSLTLPSGQMLFLGSPGTGAPYELTPENLKR
ncbi:MAG: hypothetical protein HYY76_15900 [Acidobacteria bacterium]|nr:hypothetical protein [Acidobacteriota bacterium]